MKELVLPLTWGGISAGSLFAKLNALLSAGSGGITGFKYIKKTGNFSYTTQASGIVLGYCSSRYDTAYPSATISTNGTIINLENSPSSAKEVRYSFWGIFAKSANIIGDKDGDGSITAHIFEFI